MCLFNRSRRSHRSQGRQIGMVFGIGLTFLVLAGGAVRAETIHGKFQYRDTGDNLLHPIINAEVEVWRCAPGIFGLCTWTKEQTVHTNNNGEIITQLPLASPGEEIALRVLASNPQVVVWPETAVHTAPFYREPGEPGTPIHGFAFSNSADLPFDFNFEEEWTAQHYNLAEDVRRAALYANSNLGFTLPRANVQPSTLTPFNSSFYNPVNDTIVVNTVSAFDDFVPIHEFGHFIEEQIGSLPWAPSLHDFCLVTDPGLAWMEGFADYFAAAVGRSPWGVDLSGSFLNSNFFETGNACAEPSGHDSDEYFIAATLFDLADASSPFPSKPEDHDLVQGMDGVILAIVDQMDAFGSAPTIWDFRNAWYGRGLNGDDLDRILVKHGMLPPFQKAQFVSQNVPAALVAGSTATVSIAMKNVGSTTWTQADNHLLGAQNPQDNTTWGRNRAPLPAAAVKPGETATFNFSITAPTTPGQFPFVWEMLQELVEWFPAKTPETTVISVTAASQKAQLTAQSVPSPVNPGQAFTATLTFLNTGETTWSSAGGYVLASWNDPANLWGPTSLPMPATVPPGGSVTFTINATAPLVSGTYAFQWRLQQNGVGAFGDTALAWVQVKAPTCDATQCSRDCRNSACFASKCNAGQCICSDCR